MHDPERGCVTCPLSYRDGVEDLWCNAMPDSYLSLPDSGPAPPECPLRTGPVVVEAPAKEEP